MRSEARGRRRSGRVRMKCFVVGLSGPSGDSFGVAVRGNGVTTTSRHQC